MTTKETRAPHALPWRNNRASRRAHLQVDWENLARSPRPKMTRAEAWAWAESLANPDLPSVLATSILGRSKCNPSPSPAMPCACRPIQATVGCTDCPVCFGDGEVVREPAYECGCCPSKPCPSCPKGKALAEAWGRLREQGESR